MQYGLPAKVARIGVKTLRDKNIERKIKKNHRLLSPSPFRAFQQWRTTTSECTEHVSILIFDYFYSVRSCDNMLSDWNKIRTDHKLMCFLQ